jgi:hypothetical protein
LSIKQDLQTRSRKIVDQNPIKLGSGLLSKAIVAFLY